MASQNVLATYGGFRGIIRLVGRQHDLALAGLLIAIVALFILPLPTALLDFLITTNLAASLVLLIVAMYVPSSLSLSTFPSLLLFTTLFRLSLNIASTKLILLHADAGHIIETFGRLIVANNVVVGGVVFLIIAIVQFIVIAKGSERVAEVAARFALDAMPGKQMSIDADVRAGTISAAEAQRSRQALGEECQLHGAMDGAMKFVKGDAIAGIVIALVNILAGIAIGSLMNDMSVGDAVQRYAILTIGDGMVSQIPSLLVSVAAGIVITRVASSQKSRDTHLASQIVGQVIAHPRALVVGALALSFFLLVPGFPKWSFAAWAVAIGGLGIWLLNTRRRHRTPEWISVVDAEPDDDRPATMHSIASALAVRLSPSLRNGLDHQAFERGMGEVKSALEADLGPVFPAMQVSHSMRLPEHGYEILVQDVPVARGFMPPGLVLVDTAGSNEALPDSAQAVEPFGPFNRPAWVPPDVGGPGAFQPHEVLAGHLGSVVRTHVSRLIGIQDVQRMIHWVQRDAPDLASEIANVVPLPRITEVLQRLLQEGIPVRNLRFIFESLVAWGPTESNTMMLTELVRVDMGRYITSRHVGTDRRLEALLFDAQLLERLQKAVDRTSGNSTLILSPNVTKDIRTQLARALSAPRESPRSSVVVVPLDIRRYVRKMLVEPVSPLISVLSYQELEEDVALQPVGWITNPKVV